MKILLVTGASGFIGSHFVDYLLNRYQNYYVLNLDLLTYASNESNYSHLKNHPRYRFIHGDICSRDLVNSLFSTYPIEGVVHFAAESHVDNSIHSPERFIQTNIWGTFTLVEAARTAWMQAPGQPRQGRAHCRFHHISTDEVYGSSDNIKPFSEESPYLPSSPYSASKASSDHIIRAYHRTFGLNVVLSNCSNNYGPRQHAEKFIPMIIRKALSEESIPIYGNGTNVRDWLHVHDHCTAIDQIFHNAAPGDQFNISSDAQLENMELCRHLCQILDTLAPRGNGHAYSDLITLVKDRPGHDLRYCISSLKLQQALGWQPVVNLYEGLTETAHWYLERISKQESPTMVKL